MNKSLKLFGVIAVAALILLLVLSAYGGGTTGSDRLEQRLSSALADVWGVGEATVTVYASDEDEGIRGVLIVCEGAKDPAVKTRIVAAVTTLLGIPPICVEVLMKR